ncbi:MULTISPECIES: DUF4256 domain-containing protein [unclassified Flavobacterium]|uniref:DUF4256 domain-containing protein n=1 Tax=unclassified Flavobacterium TaxID=196869 RepID=UPI001F141B78|nr:MULTISPECIES: DUF4256 domain-containing protein [unclassified Flavobacterium]UMY66043.1 DUF4256 domain-containing protein [Flavobacterium sp. HJ-32-4]
MTQPLSSEERIAFLSHLESRFHNHPERHPDTQWSQVRQRLEARPEVLESLYAMEMTGGEPDVLAIEPDGSVVFVDCAVESPKGRRSCCYDRAALDARKEHKPAHNALEWAQEMGAVLLTEAEYRKLQEVGEFDQKTSSWILTPDAIRQKGGALFCDRRYGHVFTYHNGAESYYAGRGFRAKIRL